MRILSFTNSPMSAVNEHLGTPHTYLQGWVEGLRVSLKQFPNIHLGFASVNQKDFSPFTVENSTYYNIRRPPSYRFIRAWVEQWQHKIEFPGWMAQCMRIIEDFQPDVIHVHGTEGFYGLLQSQVNIPVVISLQGLLGACEKQFFKGFQAADVIRSMLTKDFIRGGGFIHQYWIMKKAAMREVEVVKNGCFFIGRTAFDHGFVKLYNHEADYFICHEALRPEFYLTRWEFDAATPNTLYCVSAPNTYKGMDCLLDAVALIKEDNPDIRLRVSGPFKKSGLWHWINRKISLLDIADNITWLGLSSPQEVVREMKNAMLFIHPSYIDNSPNSLAEAMLLGLPCIASYVGGIPSIMTNEDNGLLFPAGDPFSLVTCILKALGDKSLMDKLSGSARRVASDRHNPIVIAQNMKNIYLAVINKGLRNEY